MIKTSTQKHLKTFVMLAVLSMMFFVVSESFAQKSDSIKITLRGKATATSKTPVIRGGNTNYKLPFSMPLYSSITTAPKTAFPTTEKNLRVSKIYPNPVSDQVNIILHLEKETQLSIKILDMLSNEVVTLSNERAQAGDQTKSFTLPKRLNTGIYFIRLIAGQESVVKRISVL